METIQSIGLSGFDSGLLTIGLLVLLALAFDFMNGFHDAANAIAAVVSTRVLKPYQAVMWAAFFNTQEYRVLSAFFAVASDGDAS